ncbi:MAG: hypothetical protein Q4F05_15415 [bacterium]|nr:hypothetical protein [bacterium]
MQKLLYYPNFEIQDLNFLKFALIYVDEIKPIIPICAMNSISEDTRRILGCTDLLKPINPGYDDGTLASAAAINYLEERMNIEQYSYKQHKDYSSLVEKRDYVLYADKYSYQFENYCMENNFGERCLEGMRVNQDVAYSYMSILADIISKDKEIDMITDCNRYADNCFRRPYSGRTRVYRQLNEIKNEIQFQIPVDMRKIPLEQFISLRANEKFNSARINFARELNKVLEMQDRDITDIDLYDYICCKKEIYGLLKEIFISCATGGVGVCSFRNALVDPTKSLDFFSNIGASVISLGSLKSSIKDASNYIEQLEGKTQARRYLAKINKLGLGTL